MSIFTETFPDFVTASLADRQDLLVNPNRRAKLVEYQSSRNSFIRMTSGVDVDGRPDLAKKYVLQGGTLNNGEKRVGVGENGAYSSKTPGGVNNLRGIRPMPGIINMTAECKTAYGSLFEATVNFTCWDIKQLEELELLFMRPGYTVLLEWGWAYKGQQPQFYNFFEEIEKPEFTFKKAYENLFKKCKENEGNYEALLGYVKNYQWSARPDGGYDCTTYILALGEVLESLKLNYAPLNIDLGEKDKTGILKAFNKDGKLYEHNLSQETNIKDYYSKGILSGLLYEIQDFLAIPVFPDANNNFQGKEYPNLNIVNGLTYDVFKASWDFKNVNTNKTPITSALGANSNYNYYITLDSLCKLVNEYVIPRADDTKVLTEVSTHNRTYAGALDKSLECLAHPLQISTDPTRCLIKGDIWINSSIPVTIDTSTVAAGAVSPPIAKLLSSSSSNSLTLIVDFLNAIDSKIDNTTTIKDISSKFKDIRNEIIWSISQIVSNSNAYILFNDNIIYFDKCGTTIADLGFNIITFLGSKNENELYDDFKKVVKLYFSNNVILRKFFEPIYESQIKTAISQELTFQRLGANNNFWGKNLNDNINKAVITNTIINAKENLKALNSLKPYFIDTTYTKGDISNIYIDIDYLHTILTNTTIESRDPSGKNIINILDFFKTICQTIQECTGNINNFDIHIDGRDSIGRIIDLKASMGKDKLFQIELHNTKSTARSYKLESRIFPEQGAIIAISAQALQQSGQLGYDNGSLTAYNKGITDKLRKKTKVKLSEDGNDQTKLYNALVNSFRQLGKYFSILNNNNVVPTKLYTTTAAIAGVNATSTKINPIDFTNNQYAAGAYNNSLRDLLGYFTAIYSDKQSFSGMIPVILSIDMDGIGGIVIGNLFKINDDVLPASNKGFDNIGQQLGFLVKNFNHKVENNDWITTIEAYQYLIPELKSIDSNFWNNFFKAGIIAGEATKSSNRPLIAEVDNTNTVIKFFQSKGYKDYQIAAIVGSLKQESSTRINPLLTNSIGNFGIAQWGGDRKNKLLTKPNNSSLQVQLDFIIEEFNTTEKPSGDKLKKSKTLEEAIVAVASYERYKGINKGINTTYEEVKLAPETGNRIRFAEDTLRTLKLNPSTLPTFSNTQILNFINR
jgi:hypothetical protein